MESNSASLAPVHENLNILFPKENAVLSNRTYDMDGRLAAYAAILFMLLLTLLGSMAAFAIFLGRRMTTADGNAANNNSTSNVDGGLQREPAPGLEKAVIESFPVFRYSLVRGLKADVKASDCVVCLCDFEDDEMLRLLPECHHAFHPECIDTWLCSHTTCPVCRMSLVPEAAEAQTEAPPEQVAVVIDDEGRGPVGDVAAESGDGSVGSGSSLIRLRKEMQQATEWYIATPQGLTPGTYRSCSFVGRQRLRSLRRLKAARSGSHKPGYSVGSVGCLTTSETVESVSENPALILRTFSERISGPGGGEGSGGGENVIREEPIFSKAISVDFQDVFKKKRTFSWLGAGDQEVAELPQSGAAVASAI